MSLSKFSVDTTQCWCSVCHSGWFISKVLFSSSTLNVVLESSVLAVPVTIHNPWHWPQSFSFQICIDDLQISIYKPTGPSCQWNFSLVCVPYVIQTHMRRTRSTQSHMHRTETILRNLYYCLYVFFSNVQWWKILLII